MPSRGDDFAEGYVPARDDIVHLNRDPAIGHEMKGPHYGLVAPPPPGFNLAAVPIVRMRNPGRSATVLGLSKPRCPSEQPCHRHGRSNSQSRRRP